MRRSDEDPPTYAFEPWPFEGFTQGAFAETQSASRAPRIERLVDVFILAAAAGQRLREQDPGARVNADYVRQWILSYGFRASTFNQALGTRITAPEVEKHPPYRGAGRGRTDAYSITDKGVAELALRAMHVGDLGRDLLLLEFRVNELLQRLVRQELVELSREELIEQLKQEGVIARLKRKEDRSAHGGHAEP